MNTLLIIPAIFLKVFFYSGVNDTTNINIESNDFVYETSNNLRKKEISKNIFLSQPINGLGKTEIKLGTKTIFSIENNLDTITCNPKSNLNLCQGMENVSDLYIKDKVAEKIKINTEHNKAFNGEFVLLEEYGYEGMDSIIIDIKKEKNINLKGEIIKQALMTSKGLLILEGSSYGDLTYLSLIKDGKRTNILEGNSNLYIKKFELGKDSNTAKVFLRIYNKNNIIEDSKILKL